MFLSINTDLNLNWGGGGHTPTPAHRALDGIILFSFPEARNKDQK